MPEPVVAESSQESPLPQGGRKRAAAKQVVTGFVDFIHNYSVLPLAIGVVVGTAVNDLVKSLVDGVISPLVGLITPEGTLASFEVAVGDSVFKIGAVIDALLNFFFVALTVYIVVKLLLRQDVPPKK